VTTAKVENIWTTTRLTGCRMKDYMETTSGDAWLCITGLSHLTAYEREAWKPDIAVPECENWFMVNKDSFFTSVDAIDHYQEEVRASCP